MFRKSAGPDALESDLPDALRAFQQALEFDRTNDEAAERIIETSEAISVRRRDYEMEQRFIDNAMGIIKDAERSRFDGDFAGAIFGYNQALNLVGLISTDFKNLHATARETSSTIRKDIKSVISEVLDAANIRIEEGEAQMLNGNYDEAIKYYNSVESIVNIIPAEKNDINFQRKQDLIDTANIQIREAEQMKKRQVETQAARTPVLPIGN